MKSWLMIVLLATAVVASRAEMPPPPDDEGQPPPPRAEDGDDFGQRPPPPGETPGLDRPPPIQMLMQYWKDKNPEEFERMKKLREEDPEAFREELHRKLEEARKEHGLGRRMDGDFGPRGGGPGDFEPMNPQLKAAEDKIRNLAQSWRSATNSEDKARLKTELQGVLSEAFDQREQFRRERLAQMEKKLTELRSTLEQRATQRQAIIEKRLNELTDGDKLAW